jgi:peptidoglycan/LPS O-acetylase OafA/YrhL
LYDNRHDLIAFAPLSVSNREMNPRFSLYLDLVRFTAALAVFLEHLATYPLTDDVLPTWLLHCGAPAVIVFFVLSGYVIAHVTATSETTAHAYVAARASRLYSVVPIALLLTFVFDRIGMAFEPDLYTIPKVLMKPESWAGYLSSLFFVNEYQVFGFNGIAPGTNNPYWSLSFEATYYLVAGLALFAPRRVSIPLTLVLFMLAGRTIFALFPVWLLGFAAARSTVGANVPRSVAALVALASAFAVLASPTIVAHLPHDNFGWKFPWGRKPFDRNLIGDYAVAIPFAIHIVAMRRLLDASAGVSRVLTATIRWLGSLTFPLYCIHFPALCLLMALSPWSNDTSQHVLLLVAGTFTLAAMLTYATELLRRTLRGLMWTKCAAPNTSAQTPNAT